MGKNKFFKKIVPLFMIMVLSVPVCVHAEVLSETKNENSNVNSVVLNVSEKDRNIITPKSAISEEWVYSGRPFKGSGNVFRYIKSEKKNIYVNRAIALETVDQLLKRLGIKVKIVSRVAKYCDGRALYEYVKDMKNEHPQSKSFFIKTEYYKSTTSDTSGRPKTYYWKLKVHYYFDSRYTQECGCDVLYAKQLLYV